MPKRDLSKAKFVRLDRKTVEEISHFLFALGNQFVNAKNADASFDCFKYSLDLNPKHQPSVHNLGALYTVMGNSEGAYKMFKEAVRMTPTDVIAMTALGEACRKLGKLEECDQTLARAYGLDKDNYLVMSAYAILHYDLGHLAEAMRWNDLAMERRPGDVHMMLNRALIQMTYGKWRESWAHYEYCLSYQRNEKMKNLSMAQSWDGSVKGGTLLVVSDQGYGDAIQFSRYLGEAKAKGGFKKLLYLVPADLKELLGRVFGVDEVLGFGENYKVDYDHYSSLLGIMRVMEIDPENCWRDPHITTDPKLDEIWNHRILQRWDPKKKRVGIVWAGDPRHGNDHARSLQLKQFLKLLKNGPCSERIQLFSFQVGEARKQLDAISGMESIDEIIDLGVDFRNFDDTASAVKLMDLMISCDTSTPHLAACSGVPVWWLIAHPSEWRHLLDRAESPWYSKSRIFRQSKPQDWDPVMSALSEELMSWAWAQWPGTTSTGKVK